MSLCCVTSVIRFLSCGYCCSNSNEDEAAPLLDRSVNSPSAQRVHSESVTEIQDADLSFSSRLPLAYGSLSSAVSHGMPASPVRSTRSQLLTPPRAGAGDNREHEVHFVADAIEVFREMKGSPTRSAYNNLVSEGGRKYDSLSPVRIKALAIQAYNQVRRPHLDSSMSTPTLGGSIETYVERVRELRGIFGDDGQINTAWELYIEAYKEQIKCVAQMAKLYTGVDCSLPMEEEQSIDQIAPNSSCVLDSLHGHLQRYLDAANLSLADLLSACTRMGVLSYGDAFVQQYEALEERKTENLARKERLQREYEDLGGMHFNPDVDIDHATGLYKAYSESKIGKLQSEKK